MKLIYLIIPHLYIIFGENLIKVKKELEIVLKNIPKRIQLCMKLMKNLTLLLIMIVK